MSDTCPYCQAPLFHATADSRYTCGTDQYGQHRGEWCRDRVRLADLESVVGRLPKTADGVPVAPGMRLYVGPRQSFIATTIHFKECKGGSTRYGVVSKLYSTRAAAEAAKGETT